MLDEMAQQHPAQHYVMVDDKLRILAAMKLTLKDRLTVFVRQGHYALDAQTLAECRPADLTIDCIGDLCNCSLPTLLGAAAIDPMTPEQRRT